MIGGMGPQASAKLLEVLIEVCAKDFGAKSDSDFPEIILNSVPVPNFITDKKNIKTVLGILKSRVKKIENFNPSCFGIACNTAHVLLKDLQTNTAVPFVSIIDEVAKKVAEAQIGKVGLLATPVTIDSGLYQKALAKKNISAVIPSNRDRKIVESIIWNVLAGRANDIDGKRLVLIAETLVKRGAQGIILGCTELPLVFPKDASLLIFDSIDILARALLQRFFESKQNDQAVRK
ncbi:MAG: amino acid racemase [bacterium]|nr:amino acid racemase [bacterium]